MDRSVLARKPMAELKDIASHLEMRGYQKLRKAELVDAIIDAATGGTGDTGDSADNGRARRVERPSGDDDRGGEGDPDPGSRAGRDEGRSVAEARESAAEAKERTASSEESRDGEESPDGEESGGASRSSGDSGRRNRESRGGGDGSGRDSGGRDSGDRDSGGRASDGDSRDGGKDAGEDDAGSRRSRRDRRRRNRGGGDGDDQQPGEVRAGVLDILPEGYGFLRTTGYLPGDRDVYVSQGQIRKHGLRPGDVVQGPIRQQRSNEKVPALHHVQKVNGEDLVDNRVPTRPTFEQLTPLFPTVLLPLGTAEDAPDAMRIIDVVAPIGRGQRALIAAPHGSGKTTLLTQIGQTLAGSEAETHVMVVLLDERPEEVTEMERAIAGEVIASTFDRAADDHTQVAGLALERAKRLVELGYDVVLLVDSLTRLARATNMTAPASGRIMPGGVDASALQNPKRFFGAARCLEEGGSLTMIATAAVDTGSQVDAVIFEEFTGTPTMELRLDERLSAAGLFPAVDVHASGTRKPERLLDDDALADHQTIHAHLARQSAAEALEWLLGAIERHRAADDLRAAIAQELRP